MIYSCRSRIFLTSLASATLIPSFHVSSFSLPSSTSFTQRNQPLGHDQSVTNHKLNLQSRQRQNEGVAFHASATAKNGTELLSTYVQSYSEHDVVTSVDIPLLKFIHEKDDPVVIDIERGLFSIQNSAKTLSIPEDLYGKKSAYRDKDVFVSSISDDLIISIPSSSSNVIKEDLKEKAVWVARMLLLLSAALYGTNFTMVKSLDESMSVGVSSTLRFGFAALSMLPWLFSPINEELKTTAKNNSYQKFISKQGFLFKMGDEPTRLSALLAGMEIGMWNSVGYIAQAEGLKTTSASKVS